MATNHSREVDCDLEIACTRDGTILGLRGHIYGDMGAYIRTNGGVVPAKAGQFLPGPYRIRDVAITVEALMTSKTPVGTFERPGGSKRTSFASGCSTSWRAISASIRWTSAAGT